MGFARGGLIEPSPDDDFELIAALLVERGYIIPQKLTSRLGYDMLKVLQSKGTHMTTVERKLALTDVECEGGPIDIVGKEDMLSYLRKIVRPDVITLKEFDEAVEAIENDDLHLAAFLLEDYGILIHIINLVNTETN